MLSVPLASFLAEMFRLVYSSARRVACDTEEFRATEQPRQVIARVSPLGPTV